MVNKDIPRTGIGIAGRQNGKCKLQRPLRSVKF